MVKNKYLRVLVIIAGLIVPLVIEKYLFNMNFFINRVVILEMISLFIVLNIIIDIKVLWNNIFKYRYIICILLFVFLVANGYHGTSIGMYDKIIQPNNSVKTAEPIFGKNRFIKTDEYAVVIPHLINQVEYNNMDVKNEYMMAGIDNVSLYPSYPTNSLSLITNISNHGYLFLPIENALSYGYYIIIIVAFMALFEFFLIITKKKKIISLMGTILIIFSPMIQWWSSFTFIAYGMLCFHFLRLFLISDNKWKKLLYSILFGWAGSCYIMIIYPAWQITYGFLYLMLFIWLIVENKDKLKRTDLLYLIPSMIIVLLLVVPQFVASYSQVMNVMNTVYPGARYVTGGESWERNYLYVSSIFYPYFNIDNACEFSQTLSMYPIPIFMGLVQLVKNKKSKKKDLLLNLLLLITLFFTVVNYFSVPFISRITLMYMVPGARITTVVGIICVILLCVLLSDYSNDKTKNNTLMILQPVSIVITGLVLVLSYRYLKINSTIDYFSTYKLVISFIIFSFINYLLLINYKKSNIVLEIFLIVLGLSSGLTIYPIVKGTDVISKKPVSQKIQELSSKDNDAIWLVTDSDFQVPNYVLANGARVINSTNFYPNFELWNVIDNNKEQDYYYNRYAHIIVHILDNDNEYKLPSPDALDFGINDENICSLNISYIYSSRDLSKEKYSSMNIFEEYNVDGSYIYKVECK